MMILILPKDYSLAAPNPIPIGAKEFNERLAVHWIPIAGSNTRTDVIWKLKEIKGDLVDEIRQIKKSRASIPKSSRIKTSNTEDFPSWFQVKGFIFGTITFSSLMSLIALSLYSRKIPTTSRFVVVAFLGGNATAKGAIPYFRESPSSFAVTGGVAGFINALVLGYVFM